MIFYFQPDDWTSGDKLNRLLEAGWKVQSVVAGYCATASSINSTVHGNFLIVLERA